MRRVPVSVGGILVDAAPRGVEQTPLLVERLPGAVFRPGIAPSREDHRILHRIPVQILLIESPASVLLVIAGGVILSEPFPRRRAQHRVRGNFQRGRRLHRGPGRRIINDRLQHRRHFIRRKIPLPLHNLVAASVENHRCRPTVILVPIGKIGARILVHFHNDVARLKQLDHFRIAVGVGVHDMAPVAPHSLQVQQHETVRALRVAEHLIRPRLPGELLGHSHRFLRGSPGNYRGRNHRNHQVGTDCSFHGSHLLRVRATPDFGFPYLGNPYPKLNAYSRSFVRKRSTTSTITDDSTNAAIVARPTPSVPPLTRNPW